jgi:phosphoglycerate-specific signal transduction histidine kinase
MSMRSMENKAREHDNLQGVLERMGSICHDLNQPLMAIGAYSELISMKLSEDDPLHETIVKMSEQIHKMGKITRKLMHMAMQEPGHDQAGHLRGIDQATLVTKYPR